MRPIFILLILFFFTAITFGQQGNINGYILYSNGDTASYAELSIPNLQVKTTADEKGYFELKEIPLGQYNVQITTLDAPMSAEQIKLTEPNLHIIFKVKASIIKDELEGTTIVTKSAKKETETKGFAVNVIETQKAALQSIQTNELLDRSAGVRIRQDGGLGSHIHYNINGLTGNAVRIFIDGVPINNFGNAFSLNSIPPALIEKIEVYKGVVPANLSEDALGGAINVVLKKQTKSTLTTSYSYGSFNTHQWNMNGAYRNAKNGFIINGSAFYNYSDNNYKVWGKDVFVTDSMGNTKPIIAKRFHDAYQSMGGLIEAGFSKVKWADNFKLGVVLAQQEKDIQHGTIMRIVYGNRTTSQQSSVFTMNYAKKNLFTKGLDVNINSSYALLSRHVIDTIGDMYTWDGSIVKFNGNPVQWRTGAEQGAPTNSIDKENNLVLRGNISYTLHKNHKLHATAFYNSFDRASKDSKKPVAEQQLKDTRNLVKQVMGVTYENLSWNERIRTNLFFKHFEQDNELIQPYWEGSVGTGTLSTKTSYTTVAAQGYGLSMSFKVLEKLYLLASMEKAIRMPAANELFGNAAENITATSSLRPEKSNNFNVGLNIGPIAINSHHIGLNTNFFYRNTADMIRLNTIDDLSETNEYTNFASIKSYGFDAELNYSYRNKFHFLFTISKFNSEWNKQFNERGEKYPQYGSQLANEPNFKFNAMATYNISHFIQANSLFTFYANVFYVDEFLRNWATFGGNNISVIPTQFTQDIGLTYAFPSKKIVLSCDIKNISNQQIFDNWALQKPGRSIYGKITYKIF